MYRGGKPQKHSAPSVTHWVMRGRKVESPASISKLKRGLMPDHKRIGDGVFELRIEYGPGYRLYFAFQEEKLILLLCGGDKGSQKRDIEKAKKMWEARKNG